MIAENAETKEQVIESEKNLAEWLERTKYIDEDGNEVDLPVEPDTTDDPEGDRGEEDA